MNEFEGKTPSTPAHAPGKAGDREGLDEIVARYNAMYDRVPEAARKFAAETWGEAWAHAEMGGLLEFAAAIAPSPTGNEAPRGVGAAGWKLVPVEPTAEMLRPWGDRIKEQGTGRANYRAMLAAAPPVTGLPPVSTEPDSRAGAEREALEAAILSLGAAVFDLKNAGLARPAKRTLEAQNAARTALAALHPSPPTASGAAAPVGEAQAVANVMEALWLDAEEEVSRLADGFWPSREAIAEAFHEHRRDRNSTLPPWSEIQHESGAGRYAFNFADRLSSLRPTPTPAPHPVPAKEDRS